MRAIFARASATYRGRIDADLSVGDICILVRDIESGGDGSVMLLKNKGVTPVNWMPSGSQINEGPGFMRIEHRQRDEILEIFFDQIYSVTEMSFDLLGDLTKHGAEREFSDLIARDLTVLGKGLTLVGREFRTTAGPVDLFCHKGRSKQPVVVEVKRRRVNLSDCYQARRYVDALHGTPDARGQNVQAILVGEVLAKNAKTLIDEDEGLSFVRLSFKALYAETASS